MEKIVVKPLPLEEREIPCKCLFCDRRYTEGPWYHEAAALDICRDCQWSKGPLRHVRGFGMPQSGYWRFDDDGILYPGTPARLRYLALHHLELAIIHLENQCKPRPSN